MDVVMREEFDAVRDMAALARAENDRLRERIAALEAKLDSIATQSTRPTPQP
jgi:BMFP domain-containing protein YqiC